MSQTISGLKAQGGSRKMHRRQLLATTFDLTNADTLRDTINVAVNSDVAGANAVGTDEVEAAATGIANANVLTEESKSVEVLSILRSCKLWLLLETLQALALVL